MEVFVKVVKLYAFFMKVPSVSYTNTPRLEKLPGSEHDSLLSNQN